MNTVLDNTRIYCDNCGPHDLSVYYDCTCEMFGCKMCGRLVGKHPDGHWELKGYDFTIIDEECAKPDCPYCGDTYNQEPEEDGIYFCPTCGEVYDRTTRETIDVDYGLREIFDDEEGW